MWPKCLVIDQVSQTCQRHISLYEAFFKAATAADSRSPPFFSTSALNTLKRQDFAQSSLWEHAWWAPGSVISPPLVRPIDLDLHDDCRSVLNAKAIWRKAATVKHAAMPTVTAAVLHRIFSHTKTAKALWVLTGSITVNMGVASGKQLWALVC